MEFKKTDFDKMHDSEILYFINNFEHTDKDYESIVKLLPYAVMYDVCKIRSVISKMRQGKKLVAIYPGIENINASNRELVGDILDGVLYLI